MNLLIKVENNKAVDHPIMEENLKYFYPDLDVNNPPEGYARFIRKPYPELTPFQKVESIEYVIDDALSTEYGTIVYTDKYNVVDLTDEELIEYSAAQVRSANEKMQADVNAPYPPPDDGDLYVWSSITNSWFKKPENFDKAISTIANKLNELGLAGLSPTDFQNLSEDKKVELQKILQELNRTTGITINTESLV
jgi:hypothetical protein